MIIDQAYNYTAFDGLSDNYSKFRPDYPDICFEIMGSIVRSSDSDKNKIYNILDVGCGTGKCTHLLRKQFAKNGKVYGIDTSSDMLNEAKKQKSDIMFSLGSAESFANDYSDLDCIVTAQAIQWFDRERFYYQVDSSLVNGGVFCILQNNRDWQNSDFLNQYETLIEEYNDAYNRNYRNIDFEDEVKKTNKFVKNAYFIYSWKKIMSFDEFYGMSISSTKMRKVFDDIGSERYKNILENLCSRYFVKDRQLELAYNTELFVFKKV